MDIEQSLAISASGLDAEKERLNVIASNLANVDSTQSTEGGPYRRRDVVFSAVPVEGSFDSLLSNQMGNTHSSVEVSNVITDTRPFKKVYEPQNPNADSSGFVLYPNVNAMEEMVNMLSALRSYEANVTAISATKNMAAKALEIGQ